MRGARAKWLLLLLVLVATIAGVIATRLLRSADHVDRRAPRESKTLPSGVRVPVAEPTASPRNVPVTGTCPARVAGRVHDAGGGAVPGAEIAVLYDMKSDGSLSGDRGASTKSDDAGAYALCALASPLSVVRVSAAGYGTLFARLALLDRVQRDFVLLPEATLRGRVTNERGGAVPSAVIEAIPSSAGLFAPAARHSMSDGEGGFLVDGLTPGPYDLVARTGDSESDLVSNVAAAVVPSAPVVLVVRKRARVSGRVIDESGAAVQEVLITARSLQFASRRSTSATTDAKGRFAIERVSEGPNAFEVEEHAVLSPPSLLVGKAGASDIEIRVARLPAVNGRVVREGKPVVGAVVSLTGHEQRSDAEGRFALTGVRPGGYELSARDPATGAAGDVRVVVPTKDEVVVALTDTGIIRGTVHDPRGAPVVGVTVIAFCSDKGFEGSAVTDSEGNFLVRGLLDGEYAFDLRRSPFGGGKVRPHTPFPSVRPSADKIVALVVELETLTIAGTVVDDKQQPVSDVRIVAVQRAKRPVNIGHMTQLPGAFTALDGTFDIGELPAGTYGLQARDADGNEAFTPNVSAGTRGLVIELKRAGVIEGRLVGFASVPDVQALRVERGQFFPPMRATVDGDRYRIEGVPPATWEVRTASAGEAATATVTVEAGQTVHADLQNRGSATIAGRVVDFVSGAGLPGIRCVVGHSDGIHRATRFLPGEAWTDATGAFTIDPAPAGPCSVTCWGPSDVSDGIATFDLQRGAHGDATIPIVTSPRQPYAPSFTWDTTLIRFRVQSVTPTWVADTAGLRAGDLVIAIDGRDARALSVSGALAFIYYRALGSEAKLVVDRDGKSIPITLPIVDTPRGQP